VHSAIKRVLVYLALSAIFYAIAIFFVDGRTAFVTVFVLGLLLGLTAEVIFWLHLFRVFRKRQSQ
jgi:site-specific recombinase